jgi:hypothetical protein
MPDSEGSQAKPWEAHELKISGLSCCWSSTQVLLMAIFRVRSLLPVALVGQSDSSRYLTNPLLPNVATFGGLFRQPRIQKYEVCITSGGPGKMLGQLVR